MEQTKASMGRKTVSFLTIVTIAGTMYTLYGVQSTFYVQFQELLGFSHTQLGILTSVAGWVTQFGFLISIFLTDRFSKRRMMTFAMALNGLAGFALSTFPPFGVMLVIFGVFAVCVDMLCWPNVLKAIRLLGDSGAQGRLFGGLEMGRGVLEMIVNFAALGIMGLLGNGLFGLKGAIWFYSGCSFVLALLAWLFIEDDEIAKVKASAAEKNKQAFEGIKTVLKNKDIWLVAFNVFLIYCVFCGMSYFAPFLNNVYALPAAFASAYYIINSMGLKLLGGPIAGFCADKLTHSAVKFIRIALGVVAVTLTIFVLFPHESGKVSIYVAMLWILVVNSAIFCSRAIYFAPMDEIQVPREYTGSAMALGSMIGYLPGAFMKLIYGWILDAYAGLSGYRIVFIIMVVFAVLGMVSSTFVVKAINRQKEAGA